MSIKSLITGNDDPWGEEWVDDRQEEFKQFAASAVNQVKAWSLDDPDTWTDDALRWAGGAIRGTGNWWQEATAEQEGVGDDVLRAIGGTVGLGMRVLDAGSYYGGKLGGSIAEMIGVDARIGGFTGNIAGDLLAGGVFTKAAKTVKMGNQLQRLRALGAVDYEIDGIVKGGYAMAHMVDSPAAITRTQDYLTALKHGTKGKAKLNKLEKSLQTLHDYPHKIFADRLYGDTKELPRKFKELAGSVNPNRNFNRVENMNLQTLQTFYEKAGRDNFLFDDLTKKLNQAYEHYEIHGTLQGLEGGTKWINPVTNDAFLIKGKGSQVDRINLGIDNIKDVNVTKELRKKYAEITWDNVNRAAAKIHPDNPKAAEVLAKSYYWRNKKEKELLEKLIADLNKKGPKKGWSLGHGRAVKAMRDANSGNADMMTNIELERLSNLVNDKGDILVRGNSSRAASDELADVVNTTLNRSRNIDEDMLKYSYKPLAEFWPQMGKITDEASFIREVGKRDAYTDAIQRSFDYINTLEVSGSMTDGQKWQMAVNAVLDETGTMNQIGIPKFLKKSKYQGIKPNQDMFY